MTDRDWAHLRDQLFFFSIVSLFTVFPLCSAEASAWNRKNGELLAISSTSYFNADLTPVETPSGTLTSRFERIDSGLYAEYGITDRLMLTANAVYGTRWLRRGFETETENGFSEIGLHLQRQLVRNNRGAIAIRAGASLPADFAAGARPGLASDGVDVSFGVLAGLDTSIGKTPIFFTNDISYIRRTSFASDQIRVDSALGIKFTKRVHLLINQFTTVSVSNEKVGGADFDVVKLQPSLVLNLSPRWSIQAAYTYETATRNLAPGNAAILSFWTRF